MRTLFPQAEVYVRGTPIENGFYDLELPDAFRWTSSKATCWLPTDKAKYYEKPALSVTTGGTSAPEDPCLLVFSEGVFCGARNIIGYDTHYFDLKTSLLDGKDFVKITFETYHSTKNMVDPRELGVPVYSVHLIDLEGKWDAFAEREYLGNQLKPFVTEGHVLFKLLKDLKLSSNAGILDVGAGKGWTTVLLAAIIEAKVYGVDISPYDNIKGLSFKAELRERFGRHASILSDQAGLESFKDIGRVLDRCSFLTMDAQDLIFKDSTFDFVFSLNAFEHIADPYRAASEIHRVLRSGGVAYIDVCPLYFSDAGHHLFQDNLLSLPWGHILYSRDQLKQMITDKRKPANEVDNILNSLNGYTAGKLRDAFVSSGLKIITQLFHQGFHYPDAKTSEEYKKAIALYPSEALSTIGLTLILRKP